MIRYEVKTIHKSFVGYEDTLEDAKAYIKSIGSDDILSVEYYDRAERETAIRNGEV